MLSVKVKALPNDTFAVSLAVCQCLMGIPGQVGKGREA